MKRLYHSFLMSTQSFKVKWYCMILIPFFFGLVEDTLDIDKWLDEDRRHRSS